MRNLFTKGRTLTQGTVLWFREQTLVLTFETSAFSRIGYGVVDKLVDYEPRKNAKVKSRYIYEVTN